MTTATTNQPWSFTHPLSPPQDFLFHLVLLLFQSFPTLTEPPTPYTYPLCPLSVPLSSPFTSFISLSSFLCCQKRWLIPRYLFLSISYPRCIYIFSLPTLILYYFRLTQPLALGLSKHLPASPLHFPTFFYRMTRV